MRLGPIFAAAALATLAAGCNKSQPSQPTSNEPAAATPAAPAMSEADKQKLLASLPAPYDSADLANGEAKFALCRSCHTIAPGGANMTGPNLYGIIGTKAGEGHDGFKFSDPLKTSNIVWTPDKMDPWIHKPQELVPGTKMTFAGLNDEKDRKDLIAYLMVETGYKPQ
jgi:cytochrome c